MYDFIDIKETAEILGISVASVRNWIIHSYLNPVGHDSNMRFNSNDVFTLKAKIENGEIERLQKRANKRNSTKNFIPDEYFNNKDEANRIDEILKYVEQNKLQLKESIYYLTLNYLKKNNLIDFTSVGTKIKIKDAFNKSILNEIRNWASLEIKESNERRFSLIEFDLPAGNDILGTIYQSLLREGNKAKEGSYYTPHTVVDNILKEYISSSLNFLDPCCGTGQFILKFADISNDPLSVTGFDVDSIAVKIARINLLTRFKEFNFEPNIYIKNSLLLNSCNDLFNQEKYSKKYDLIATNPPWGLHLEKEDQNYLKRTIPFIKSLESFSYFLVTAYELLKFNGIISFILPESILNVKMHEDIREYLLIHGSILKIEYLGRIFKNVFTPVIRFDYKKNESDNKNIHIIHNSRDFIIEQTRFKNNPHFYFDILINNTDNRIIEKVYNSDHITLKSKAEWALGIVTGDNNKYIKQQAEEGFEAIYRGKDISNIILIEPTHFIKFEPDKYQQVAPLSYYRAKEKLIYRFISKYLVFAYDNNQILTLNSANILIPKVKNYSLKVICALFNSSLYQFIFQKKFNSIKVLRSHLEELPLPNWNTVLLNEIVSIVDEVLKGRDSSLHKDLDTLIMDGFELEIEERDYIKNFLNQN